MKKNSISPSNVIEGDTNILETEIVEGDHADKDGGEGEDLLDRGGADGEVGERDEAGQEAAGGPQRVAAGHRHQALQSGAAQPAAVRHTWYQVTNSGASSLLLPASSHLLTKTREMETVQ